ncbi:hypothetical protein BH10PSE13_BH10PSE13_24330 [soil metagenome]
MKRAVPALTFAILLAGAAQAQPGRSEDRGTRSSLADPAAVIRAEIAIGQLAVAKGQWEAMARMAAKDAVLLTPQPVPAQRWLKSRPPATPPARLNTHLVFLSCDGSTALTAGTWSRPDGAKGWYRAVWQREGKKRMFQWLLGTAGTLDQSAEEPDAISAKVAQCSRRGPEGEDPQSVPAVPALDPNQPLPITHEEKSMDGSLRWRWAMGAGGAAVLEGWMVTETGERQVLPVAPGVPPA